MKRFTNWINRWWYESLGAASLLILLRYVVIAETWGLKLFFLIWAALACSGLCLRVKMKIEFQRKPAVEASRRIGELDRVEAALKKMKGREKL